MHIFHGSPQIADVHMHLETKVSRLKSVSDEGRKLNTRLIGTFDGTVQTVADDQSECRHTQNNARKTSPIVGGREAVHIRNTVEMEILFKELGISEERKRRMRINFIDLRFMPSQNLSPFSISVRFNGIFVRLLSAIPPVP